MNLHLAADPADAPRPVARVGEVAAILAEHPREIRRMLAAGEIEGHRKGKRGIRIYLDSVRAYQERRHIVSSRGLPAPEGPHGAQAPATRAPASTARFRASLAKLRALGLV